LERAEVWRWSKGKDGLGDRDSVEMNPIQRSHTT
jgi:hypothetical protein